MSYVMWQAEVNFLSDLKHPNLVKLIGYCNEDDQRLLVYEFMPRGSLENHLFRSMLFPFSQLNCPLPFILYFFGQMGGKKNRRAWFMIWCVDDYLTSLVSINCFGISFNLNLPYIEPNKNYSVCTDICLFFSHVKIYIMCRISTSSMVY